MVKSIIEKRMNGCTHICSRDGKTHKTKHHQNWPKINSENKQKLNFSTQRSARNLGQSQV
jgi:hypothetical protein